MEITLEKIELVKDRTGVSYKAAKEALEQTDGNVIDAIIYIEECEIENEESRISTEKKELLEKIKSVVKKGNVTKIQFKKDDQVILNIPVTAGAIGSVFFPLPAITAAIAALAVKCSVEIVKDTGDVVDLNELSGGRIDNIRDKAEDVILNIGDTVGNVLGNIKDKVEDYNDIKFFGKENEELQCVGDCSNCGFDCSITGQLPRTL